MVSNQEDFTAPIALLKINRSRRSNLIIPRDLVPSAFPLKVGEAGKGPGFMKTPMCEFLRLIRYFDWLIASS